jgi:hypothetical protein
MASNNIAPPLAGKTDPRLETLRLLQSIDATLKQLLARFPAPTTAADPAMTDAELDQPFSDELIRMIPRDYAAGDVVKGTKMSLCPPAFLEQYAQAHDYFAQKNDADGVKAKDDKPKSVYDRRTARRARAWATRLRGGWTPPITTIDTESAGF